MRLSPFALLTGAVALASAEILSEVEEIKKEDAVSDGPAVPALLELTPTNWETELKKTKYIFIKHFSPYCPHCIDFAPTFQSIYEFYYNSKPTGVDAEGRTFTDFYDFRFGIINCIAYYDLCMDHAVQSYPTSILYEDGQVMESLRGVKNATVLSNTIEKALEKYKPGTRPETLNLPEVKDENAAEKKKEAKEAWKKLEAERKEKEAKEAEEKKRKKAEQQAAQELAADEKMTEKGTSDKKAPEKSLDDVTERPGSPDESASKSDEAAKPTESAKSTENETTDSEKPVKANEDVVEKKFGEDWKVATTGEMLKKTKPKEPAKNYNPEGISTPLTPDTFQTLVTSTQDPWFIKFYAPWCSHCKAMAPNWAQMAKEMAGKLNVGEVNCDAESRFCKEMNARAYPTIRFYRGTESADYRGLRGVGDFVQYADKALEVAVGIPDIDSKTLKEMEKEDDVIFVYFYDHATTSEDFKALDQLPLNLIGHAKIVKTNDKEIIERFKITTFPRFLVSREGLPTYYTPITPDEMRDVDTLTAWMKSVWLPLVPELTANNARQIMEHKIVALAVLNRDSEDRLKTSIQELKGAAGEWMNRQVTDFQLERQKLREAKASRIQAARDRGDSRGVRNAKAIKIDMESTDRREVAFAWIDGIFWARWLLETYGIDVKDGDRVLITEEDRKRFWDSTTTGNHIMVTRVSIIDTLEKVVYGPNPIETKYTLSAFSKFFFDIKMSFIDRPIVSIGFVVAIVFGVWTWIRRSGRSRSSYLFPHNDDSMGLKDGLLGQSMSTKSD
ncbi:hypothetical protein B0T10DRAFT_216620 [Thelonectria olida]|uniref:Thioredoxin domain-containing protein n=1 Tax=Thelonectria olida TaxID=1576542 RepID=A0A9P9ATQ0_9HYPO|nr:hypothetical protein B0T10DRAFT_216620 [Thelonectria olida]